jgi:hypothetical protein
MKSHSPRILEECVDRRLPADFQAFALSVALKEKGISHSALN